MDFQTGEQIQTSFCEASWRTLADPEELLLCQNEEYPECQHRELVSSG